MPIYAPRKEPIRKIEVLEKRIMELKKCTRTNASEEMLMNKAEKVRVAQLNLIKARLALLTSYRFEDKTDSKEKVANKLEKEYQEWEKRSIEFIIKEYQQNKNTDKS